VTDKNVDVTGRLQKTSQTVSEYKDSLMNHFDDMDVEWRTGISALETRIKNIPLRLTLTYV